MANQIQQDHAIDTALGHIRETKQLLDGVRTTVDGEVHGNLASGWKGQGSSGFLQAHTTWSEKHTKVSGILDELANALEGARKKGSSADDEVKHQASSHNSYMEQFSTRL